MFIITTNSPTFGRGYFIGFDRENRAHFQSGNDRSVKTYKTRHGAKRQLQRIIASSGSLAEGETFSIENAPASPLCTTLTGYKLKPP